MGGGDKGNRVSHQHPTRRPQTWSTWTGTMATMIWAINRSDRVLVVFTKHKESWWLPSSVRNRDSPNLQRIYIMDWIWIWIRFSFISSHFISWRQYPTLRNRCSENNTTLCIQTRALHTSSFDKRAPHIGLQQHCSQSIGHWAIQINGTWYAIGRGKGVTLQWGKLMEYKSMYQCHFNPSQNDC